MASPLLLKNRELPELGDGDSALMKQYCLDAAGDGVEAESDLGNTILKMLGHSSPFLSLLSYVESYGEEKGLTKILPINEGFRRLYKENLRGDGRTLVGALTQAYYRELEAVGLPTHAAKVHSAWHGVLTTFDPEDDFLMVGARVKGTGALNLDQICNLLYTFELEKVNAYANHRMGDEHLEALIGQKTGAVNIFLADQALEGAAGVFLNKSHVAKTSAGDVIIFTMHPDFAFVCSAKDFQSWLKTNAARSAFDDKLRVESHLFPATVADFEALPGNVVARVVNNVRGRAEVIRRHSLNEDSEAAALMGAIQAALKSTGIDWRNRKILDQILKRT